MKFAATTARCSHRHLIIFIYLLCHRSFSLCREWRGVIVAVCFSASFCLRWRCVYWYYRFLCRYRACEARPFSAAFSHYRKILRVSSFHFASLGDISLSCSAMPRFWFRWFRRIYRRISILFTIFRWCSRWSRLATSLRSMRNIILIDAHVEVTPLPIVITALRPVMALSSQSWLSLDDIAMFQAVLWQISSRSCFWPI